MLSVCAHEADLNAETSHVVCAWVGNCMWSWMVIAFHHSNDILALNDSLIVYLLVCLFELSNGVLII